jgi:hypothetical protein
MSAAYAVNKTYAGLDVSLTRRSASLMTPADLVRMVWFRVASVRSIDAQFVRSLLLSRQQLLQSRRNIETRSAAP